MSDSRLKILSRILNINDSNDAVFIRMRHIAKFRNVSIWRAFNLFQKSLMNQTMNLLNDSKISEFHRRLCDFKIQNVFMKKIQTANRQFKIHRNWFKKTARWSAKNKHSFEIYINWGWITVVSCFFDCDLFCIVVNWGEKKKYYKFINIK